MWYKNCTFYQIYPFGFCGAPDENDGIQMNRINKITDWIPHLQGIGIDALYLCPIFESDAHGYDTRDYKKVDCRLGNNSDFVKVCDALHKADIRIVLDGVFNHVGRGFWAFRDVQEKRELSSYRDWFYLDFGGNSNYDDGFGYEGWEGHYNMVKLNLNNSQVVDYLFDCIRGWAEEFDIDGLRLDVAYMLNKDFLRKLRRFCKSLNPEFLLIGETIHGDYNQLVNDEMLDSCTNYECFKGIYSSFNDMNLFEIAYSLNRQFGSDQGALYRGLLLFNFVDNHDVARLASNLREPNHLKSAYALLFTMPGIPCIYYGSEWGVTGEKISGSDANLRPAFPMPIENEKSQWISQLSKVRKNNIALREGDYQQIYLTNRQFIFSRQYEDNRIIIAINADIEPHTAHIPLHDTLRNLIKGDQIYCDGNIHMSPFSAEIYLEG